MMVLTLRRWEIALRSPRTGTEWAVLSRHFTQRGALRRVHTLAVTPYLSYEVRGVPWRR